MTHATRLSRFGFVNAYLVSEADGLTLIDTMLPRSAGGILSEVGEEFTPLVAHNERWKLDYECEINHQKI